MIGWRHGFAAFALGLLITGGWARAADVRVTPIRISLTPSAAIAAMHIENTGNEEVLMQLRVMQWSQEAGHDKLTPTSDVLANPPDFRIPAGGDQIVRFGLQTQQDQTEKTYRVLIDQVPQRSASQANEVRTVLRISVPIFVPGLNAVAQLHWSLSTKPGAGAVLRLGNNGGAHIEVDRLELRDLQDKIIARVDRPAYVLAGQSHTWVLPNSSILPIGKEVRVIAQTDRQQSPETATVVVEHDAPTIP